MGKYDEVLLNAWKQYLTICRKSNIELDKVLNILKDRVVENLKTERDERGWFLFNNKYYQIAWRILDPKTEKLGDNKSIPIEICVFYDDENGETHTQNLLEFFEIHMYDEAINIIQKSTFELI
jgi:hypothetical protein